MTPAADISCGSNFSINSVLMQNRAVSNRAQRLSTKYGAIVTVGYRPIRSIRSIPVFLSDSAADSREWSENPRIYAVQPGMRGVPPQMRAFCLGFAPSRRGWTR